MHWRCRIFIGFGAGVFWYQREGIFHLSAFWLVHPFSAIPGSAVARDLVLIVLKIKLVVVRQLELTERQLKAADIVEVQ